MQRSMPIGAKHTHALGAAHRASLKLLFEACAVYPCAASEKFTRPLKIRSLADGI